jgi:hypothetical protein
MANLETGSTRSALIQETLMTNRRKKSQADIAGTIPAKVCTRTQAYYLLQGLRREYHLLTLEERSQVKMFVLGFSLSDASHHPTLNMRKLVEIQTP